MPDFDPQPWFDNFHEVETSQDGVQPDGTPEPGDRIQSLMSGRIGIVETFNGGVAHFKIEYAFRDRDRRYVGQLKSVTSFRILPSEHYSSSIQWLLGERRKIMTRLESLGDSNRAAAPILASEVFQIDSLVTLLQNGD